MAALQRCAEWFAAYAEDQCYGAGAVDDPHHFAPAEEECTPEEIATHKAACEAWDRGERDFERPGCRPNEEPFETRDATGAVTVHAAGTALANYQPWGTGTYVVRSPEMLELRDLCVAALGEQP